MVSFSPAPSATACPLCRSLGIQEFFALRQLPVSLGLLFPTMEAALQAPTGDLSLCVCRQCGFIFNRLFDPARMFYQPGYEISLDHSPTYQAHVQASAQRLVDRYDLRHKAIVEVGCGKGYFLRTLCALGANRGVGFDPALTSEGAEAIGAGQVRFVRAVYDSRYADLPADLICCRSVLELINNPRGLVEVVRQAVGPHSEPVIFFELPNAEYVFGAAATWSAYYEHCSYFTPNTLARLFTACGFQVLEVAPTYVDGQYLSLVARPGVTPASYPTMPMAEWEQLHAQLSDYAQRFQRRIADWQARLSGLCAAGKRVVAWGAGGRAINLTTILQTRGQIEVVVDINPDRQGKFMPVTGQPVVAPAQLPQQPPDVIIITNPTYSAEIMAQVRGMGIHCDFLEA
jgi:SAM-dependent methyltransferase